METVLLLQVQFALFYLLPMLIMHLTVYRHGIMELMLLPCGIVFINFGVLMNKFLFMPVVLFVSLSAMEGEDVPKQDFTKKEDTAVKTPESIPKPVNTMNNDDSKGKVVDAKTHFMNAFTECCRGCSGCADSLGQWGARLWGAKKSKKRD